MRGFEQPYRDRLTSSPLRYLSSMPDPTISGPNNGAVVTLNLCKEAANDSPSGVVQYRCSLANSLR